MGDDVIGFLCPMPSGCHDCEGHSHGPEDSLADQTIRSRRHYYHRTCTLEPGVPLEFESCQQPLEQGRKLDAGNRALWRQ